MYYPFSENKIPPARLEQAVFGFICQHSDWIIWPNMKQQFAKFKKLYFGQDAWILHPIERSVIHKMDQKKIPERRMACLMEMLRLMQERQNRREDLYWLGYLYNTCNRQATKIYNSYNNGDKTLAEVKAEREHFMKISDGAIQDAVGDYEFTNRTPSADLRRTCNAIIDNMDREGLFLLSDAMEEEGFDAEADHFRTVPYHTWACPVLRKIAGVVSGRRPK